MIKETKFYYLRIEFHSARQRTFGLVFRNAPVRADVDPVFRREWDKLKPAEQDCIWEWLLILNFIPNIPWLGTISTWYGDITCVEKYMIDNEQEVSETTRTDQGCSPS